MKAYSDYCRKLWNCLAGIETTRQKPLLESAFDDCIVLLHDVRERQSTVHLIGNGGSAAVVMHAETDFIKACGIRADSHGKLSLMTAYANDCGYEHVYADVLRKKMDPDDVLIAVSSSGKSRNILNAVKEARARECTVLTLSGFKPNNPLRSMGDINFYVPSTDYGHVELTHAAILHCLTDRLAQ